MIDVVSFIAPAMAPPSATAATASTEPTMARIRAYSAAEAPETFFRSLMNLVVVLSFPQVRPRRSVKPHRDDVEESGDANPGDCRNPTFFKRFGSHRLSPPGRPAAYRGYLWLTLCQPDSLTRSKPKLRCGRRPIHLIIKKKAGGTCGNCPFRLCPESGQESPIQHDFSPPRSADSALVSGI